MVTGMRDGEGRREVPNAVTQAHSVHSIARYGQNRLPPRMGEMGAVAIQRDKPRPTNVEAAKAWQTAELSPRRDPGLT
jgi:hypothetical protein